MDKKPDKLEWVKKKPETEVEAKVEKTNWHIHVPEDETVSQKAWRKIKYNPFIPLGLTGTVAALSYGLYMMKTGNRQMQQKMMRARIGAQAFTYLACIVGVLITAQFAAPKEEESKE